MLHCEGTIELIKHRFFSVNDKFYAIVDNLKVPICNDYLYVTRSISTARCDSEADGTYGNL
jgi:hypothetical protein